MELCSKILQTFESRWLSDSVGNLHPRAMQLTIGASKEEKKGTFFERSDLIETQKHTKTHKPLPFKGNDIPGKLPVQHRFTNWLRLKRYSNEAAQLWSMAESLAGPVGSSSRFMKQLLFHETCRPEQKQKGLALISWPNITPWYTMVYCVVW